MGCKNRNKTTNNQIFRYLIQDKLNHFIYLSLFPKKTGCFIPFSARLLLINFNYQINQGAVVLAGAKLQR